MKKKYTEEQLQTAKELYMRYGGSRKQISNISGIAFDTLKYYIGKYWKSERELRKNEMIAALTESKQALMSSISKYGLEILEKSLKKIHESDRDLSPAEIVKVAGVISEIDRITNSGKEKNINILSTIQPKTVIEVREVLKNDPFYETTATLVDVIESKNTGNPDYRDDNVREE
jgi:hypothetical protein